MTDSPLMYICGTIMPSRPPQFSIHKFLLYISKSHLTSCPFSTSQSSPALCQAPGCSKTDCSLFVKAKILPCAPTNSTFLPCYPTSLSDTPVMFSLHRFLSALISPRRLCMVSLSYLQLKTIPSLQYCHFSSFFVVLFVYRMHIALKKQCSAQDTHATSFKDT